MVADCDYVGEAMAGRQAVIGPVLAARTDAIVLDPV
jgi:hypothetical protein